MEKSRGGTVKVVVASIFITAAILLVATGILVLRMVKPFNAVSNETEDVAPAKQPTSTTYKNGTYTSVGTYVTMHGPTQIGITLRINEGKVVAASGEVMATNPTSAEYQADFVNSYKSAVVGKSLASLQLSKVSRSSLTPKGFNDAVEQIRAEAKI